jgi:hypothetical protein
MQLTFKAKIGIAVGTIVIGSVTIGLLVWHFTKKKTKPDETVDIVDPEKEKRLWYINQTVFSEGQDVPSSFINREKDEVFYVKISPFTPDIGDIFSCIEKYATLLPDGLTFRYDMSSFEGDINEVKVPPLCTKAVPVLRSSVTTIKGQTVKPSDGVQTIDIVDLDTPYSLDLTIDGADTSWIVNQSSVSVSLEDSTKLPSSQYRDTLDFSRFPQTIGLSFTLLSPSKVKTVNINILWYNGKSMFVEIPVSIPQSLLDKYKWYRLVTRGGKEFISGSRVYMDTVTAPTFTFTDDLDQHVRHEKTGENGELITYIRQDYPNREIPETVLFSTSPSPSFILKLAQMKDGTGFVFYNVYTDDDGLITTNVLYEDGYTHAAKGVLYVDYYGDYYDGDDAVVFTKVYI